MQGEAFRGRELAEEGERWRTGVALWREPCGEGVVQTRAEANKGVGMRQGGDGEERTEELRLGEQIFQCWPGPPRFVPPPPPGAPSVLRLEAWRSPGSHLQEVRLAFSVLQEEVPQVLKLGPE